MRLGILAVGRLKSGPESDLAERYAGRLGRTARPLGFEWTGVSEIPEARGATAAQRCDAEGQSLQSRIPDGSHLIVLDERGKALSSERFARHISGVREAGGPALMLAIGGPDGHGEEMRSRADLLLGLGSMTWPHQIARALVLEQLYRATTILSGHPYHRS